MRYTQFFFAPFLLLNCSVPSYLVVVKDHLSTCVLGSSSAGNATLIWDEQTVLLIDCGFGPDIMSGRLGVLGLGFGDLDGVFITHIHGDHIHEATVRRLIRECVPIYCPPKIDHHLKKKYKSLAAASHGKIFAPMKNEEIEVHTLSVRSFEVPHDSAGGCYGYSISGSSGGRTKKVTVSTDLVRMPDNAVQQFADSDVMVLESNYDPAMLDASDRPGWLKKRIKDDGHLSNDECASSLLRIIDGSDRLPQYVALAHVSQQCNTNELARECTSTALGSRGIAGIGIEETHPDKCCNVMVV
jgi:phosphoribosyl 1,2-cyclic phosphodiesterase